MLVACFLTSLFYSYVTVQCQNLLPVPHHDSNELIKCIINILDKYFAEEKEVTFVNMDHDSDALLKAIHSTLNMSLVIRLSTEQMIISNRGYLVLSEDVAHFTEYFKYLIREAAWNPYARFLVIIKTIQNIELRLIFDELLKQHVINALVVNASDGQLHTYNPFENYACGRYYNNVITYGPCKTTDNLYPNKLVTGLRRCHFKASLAHRPPYSIDPSKRKDKNTLLGTEEYIIKILGETEEFTVSFNYSYDGDQFSSVESNMTAIGPMAMLQKNECDIILGGMIMVTSRAEAFTYLGGYHDYHDELRFVVKSASLIPTWKYIYLEFELNVWFLLVGSFVMYSIITLILLGSNDMGEIVLRLLDNLLLRGRDVRTRFTVKCVLITWVWFAYLINTFYQSSLFSFTTNPVMDYQVSNEEDMIKYNFRPCFSDALQIYLSTENNTFGKYTYFQKKGCETTAKAMDTVGVTKDMFTLIPNYLYLYDQRKYNDKWGNSLIYQFHKPYMKFLYGYFFYKGFPITKKLQVNALRMRESGLVEKKLHEHYYARKLKQQFSQKSFEPHFLFPWWLCFSGFVIATVTFVIEILIKH